MQHPLYSREDNIDMQLTVGLMLQKVKNKPHRWHATGGITLVTEGHV